MNFIVTEKKNLQITVEKESGLDVSSPKHGKVDEKNEPHVGGNTWAGGTGGRDTAGLGGKGGPYRLDAKHKVFQVGYILTSIVFNLFLCFFYYNNHQFSKKIYMYMFTNRCLTQRKTQYQNMSKKQQDKWVKRHTRNVSKK